MISKAVSEESKSCTSDFDNLPLTAQIQRNLLGGKQTAIRALA